MPINNSSWFWKPAPKLYVAAKGNRGRTEQLLRRVMWHRTRNDTVIMNDDKLARM
jgi:hypothetical protein